jgi:hypothetical protein
MREWLNRACRQTVRVQSRIGAHCLQKFDSRRPVVGSLIKARPYRRLPKDGKPPDTVLTLPASRLRNHASFNSRTNGCPELKHSSQREISGYTTSTLSQIWHRGPGSQSRRRVGWSVISRPPTLPGHSQYHGGPLSHFPFPAPATPLKTIAYFANTI